jgi:hypothetical protein
MGLRVRLIAVKGTKVSPYEDSNPGQLPVAILTELAQLVHKRHVRSVRSGCSSADLGSAKARERLALESCVVAFVLGRASEPLRRRLLPTASAFPRPTNPSSLAMPTEGV